MKKSRGYVRCILSLFLLVIIFMSTAIAFGAQTTSGFTYKDWLQTVSKFENYDKSYPWPLVDQKIALQKSLTYEELLTLIMTLRKDSVQGPDRVLHNAYDVGLLKGIQVPGASKTVTKEMAEKLIQNMKEIKLNGKYYSLEERIGMKPFRIRSQDELKAYGLANAYWIKKDTMEIIFAQDPERLSPLEINLPGLAIKAAAKKMDCIYELSVAGLKEGSKYKIGVGETREFAIPIKVTTPVWLLTSESKALDSETIKLKFTRALTDECLDLKNYKLDNNLVVKSASFAIRPDKSIDRTIVLLKTEKQVYGKLYTLTVAETTKDYFGNAIHIQKKANTLAFGGVKADDNGPVLAGVKEITGTTIEVTFNEESTLEGKSALEIANYKLYNTTLGSAVSLKRAKYSGSYEEPYRRILIETDYLKPNNSYILEVQAVKDKFGNEISKTENYKAGFATAAQDQTSPVLIGVEGISLNLVKLVFSEDMSENGINAMENYQFQRNVKAVKAWISDYDKKVVYVETTAQDIGVVSTLRVYRVMDNSGNPISLGSNWANYYSKTGSEDRLYVSNLVNEVEGNRNVVLLYFSKPVNPKQALLPENYDFGALGTGVYVTKVSDVCYKVLTNFQLKNVRYDLFIYNVEDFDGNVVDMSASYKVLYGSLIQVD